MKNSGRFVVLFLVLSSCLLSLSEGSIKFCPAEMKAQGQCSGMFGTADCFHQMRAKYGEAPSPPTNCKCTPIPNDLQNYKCKCDVAC
ncbi:hypothetical protein I3843_13G046500 [Carya illinoinensis]|uniref:Uncharacterized protein n=1 Tax=Carya illinoinensis TaxID=32201 RepID=A0A8T1NME0_CARIL|nr:hypothetical protein I3760_13G053700 [Carya illinoinensis]KAG6630931.1 hypothetical protein CIPAW_13G055400 [Carya illinoinensis]KAG6680685.1 hypothetical protein I3842_13G055000 [Carya illinoinensis]KAG7949148.1 hypothetical protein I3843_13G046500 [Carya illinoinensis]